METPVLVLDEPSRGLDHGGKRHLLALLKALRAAGRSLLLISHDLALVAELADRVFVLEDGRLSGGAAREVLLDEATLERAGLDLPPAARLAKDLGLRPVLTEAELFAARPT
jgi:energy-coupling factor transport system ATP-binding protein